MNLNFNKSIKSCCTWLFFGLFLLGLSPDAIASTLTIKNEGDCAVNIYHWISGGDVFQTTLQPDQNFQVDGSNGDTYRAVDTDNVWSNLIFDEHYTFNNNANQTWTINPNYCTGASNDCSGEITGFLLDKQDGSALLDLQNGATFCESDFPKDIRIRTTESGTHESVKFTITGPTGTWSNVENYVTYDSKQFWPTPGEWTVNTQLYKGHNASGTKCDEEVIKFTISDCNSIPSGCTERTVSNTKNDCGNGDPYSFHARNIVEGLNLTNLHTVINSSFVENNDGTANFKALVKNSTDTDIRYELDITFSGRTITPPVGSPKVSNCFPVGTDYYYYTSTSGTIKGKEKIAGALLNVSRSGEAFQIGTGANMKDANIFGASGWLSYTIVSQPNDNNFVLENDAPMDINIRLSRTTTECDTLVAPVFDCPQLSANIGDACDDGDANTENDCPSL